jgi:hypothetical protein
MNTEMLTSTKTSLARLAAAMDDALKQQELVPLDWNCHTECSVSIGPDGQPVYSCRLVCGF